MPSRRCGRRASTSRLSRPRRSATSGSPTATGSSGNLRRRPWLALLLPAFLLSYARAARRAARDADLVHAHWLPSGLVALATGKPYVVQLWGTDVELARKAPWLFRPILRRARLAIVASEFLAAAARELGARDVRVVPSPVELPESVGEPDDPPHVLFVGRLSPEKGIHEFLAATEGLPRVIVGAGPVDGARGGRLRPARASSAATTSAPRSSASRPGARATASSRGRRWRTGARWWRRRSAGSSTRSRTA